MKIIDRCQTNKCGTLLLRENKKILEINKMNPRNKYILLNYNRSPYTTIYINNTATKANKWKR